MDILARARRTRMLLLRWHGTLKAPDGSVFAPKVRGRTAQGNALGMNSVIWLHAASVRQPTVELTRMEWLLRPHAFSVQCAQRWCSQPRAALAALANPGLACRAPSAQTASTGRFAPCRVARKALTQILVPKCASSPTSVSRHRFDTPPPWHERNFGGAKAICGAKREGPRVAIGGNAWHHLATHAGACSPAGHQIRMFC